MSHITNAYACWLRNAPINDEKRVEEYREWARELAVPGPLSEVLQTAVAELMDDHDAMLGVRPHRSSVSYGSARILIGVRGQLHDLDAELSWQDGSEDGYLIRNVSIDGQSRLVVAGHSAKGALYAVFHLLRLMQYGESLADLAITETSANGAAECGDGSDQCREGSISDWAREAMATAVKQGWMQGVTDTQVMPLSAATCA